MLWVMKSINKYKFEFCFLSVYLFLSFSFCHVSDSSISFFSICSSTEIYLFQDFGYVQTTSTEVLKSYVFNEPIVVDAARLPPLGAASIFVVTICRVSYMQQAYIVGCLDACIIYGVVDLSKFLFLQQGTKRMPATAITKSVVANEPGGKKRDEIFVDVIEKISVTFNSSVSLDVLFSLYGFSTLSGVCFSSLLSYIYEFKILKHFDMNLSLESGIYTY